MTATVSVIDDAGNTAQTAALSLVKDTTADVGGNLAVSLDLAVVDAAHRARTGFSVTGLDAGASAVVSFTDSAGHRVTAIAPANGHGLADLSSLADGAVVVGVTAIDTADNASAGAGATMTLATAGQSPPPAADLALTSVNAFETTYVPVMVTGLGGGASAVLTFTDHTGAFVTLPASGNGPLRANLSALAAGAVAVSMAVGGATPTAGIKAATAKRLSFSVCAESAALG